MIYSRLVSACDSARLEIKTHVSRLETIDLFGRYITKIQQAVDPQFDFLPLYVKMTSNCDCACHGCTAVDTMGIYGCNEEVDYSLFMYVLDTLADKQLLKSVTLTGGEPMAHSMFGRFVNNAHFNKVPLKVNTTGTRDVKSSATLAGIDELSILCYSPDQEQNGQIARNPNVSKLLDDLLWTVEEKVQIKVPLRKDTCLDLSVWIDRYPNIKRFMFMEPMQGSLTGAGNHLQEWLRDNAVHKEVTYYDWYTQRVYVWNDREITIVWPCVNADEHPDTCSMLVLSPRGLSGSWRHNEKPIFTIGRLDQ